MTMPTQAEIDQVLASDDIDALLAMRKRIHEAVPDPKERARTLVTMIPGAELSPEGAIFIPEP